MIKMDFKRKLYFSFLGYLISFVQSLFAKIQKPFMVYGYYNKVQRKFFRNIRISSSAVIMSSEQLDIEDNVWIWHNSIIDATHGVKIGEGCQIGANVGIFTHSSHIAIRLLGQDFIKIPRDKRLGYITKSTEIGKYTFISSGSYVLAGVKIGKGCVIGSNTVVTKDIPDFSVVAGAPAKIIKSILDDDRKFFNDPLVQRYYFDPEIIEAFKNTNI